MEKLGYLKENNYYIKRLGEYTIKVYLTNDVDKFIRRIEKRNTTIDIKKIIGIENIERDAIFNKVIAEAPRVYGTQPYNGEVLLGCGADKGIENEKEIHLNIEKPKEVNIHKMKVEDNV